MTALLLRDVTLRDGLQDETPVLLASKLEVFEALLEAGVTDLELTSFVRPDRVPAMADAEALCAATDRAGITRWGLVLNPRGAERALSAGLRHLQYVVSVSDSHSRRNAGAPTDQAMAGLAEVAALAAAAGAALELTLATAFGCPYDGPVDPDRVATLAARAVGHGASSVSLADTIGVAVPTEVRALVAAVRPVAGVPVGVHLHDTRGLGLANALAAVDAGADRVDGTVGALGGCPFAPGASGNLALEDLVHALEAMGVRTGLSVTGLVAAAHVACGAVGRPVGSHVGLAGPRFANLQGAPA
ncbi:MAG: hydroxymethylglutaryl-CoA lyase [Mycobacteriales bacterium]